MEGTGFLVEILVVLLFAKLAAEAAERIGLPAVVGEILAGVIAGPSVLGWVGDGELLITLAEIGAILLLLEVGLEMDLRELGAVGRAALGVAVLGVILPFIGGTSAAAALGMSTNEAIFIGAALTATSVGITARVFGDLRALASVEARTVLGAAVADDVLGLVILTVVVRLVDSGSITATEVLRVSAVAVAFLVVATLIAIRLVPAAFAAVEAFGRSTGTLVGLALAFTLAMAKLADVAGLAPIIGAFVAGIGLARSSAAGRLVGDLRPVGHLFIPVFFFRIGVDADLASFADPDVLALAGVLIVIGVLGKVVSPLAMGRAPGDRMTIGIGMIPRGEVGLIFATIGLQQGVFGADEYAAVLLVVLATTLVGPPMLRARIMSRRRHASAPPPADRRPTAGWLRETDSVVDLAARPPVEEAFAIAVDAALRLEKRRPAEGLLAWLDSLPEQLPTDDSRSQAALARLIAEGDPRAWRFLLTAGVLGRALPELDRAVARRAADPFDPDPLGHLQWPRVDRLHADGRVPPLVVAVAALVLDASEGDTGREARKLARALARHLGFGPAAAGHVEDLVADADVLVEMASSPLTGPDQIRQLAVHVGDRSRLEELAELTGIAHELDAHQRSIIADLVEDVGAALRETGEASASVAERRAAAATLVSGMAVDRVQSAPPTHVLRVTTADLAQQAASCEPPPGRGEIRVTVRPGAAGRWGIVMVARDRVGLLAHECRVLAATGFDVVSADATGWPDGVVLAAFEVVAPNPPDPDVLAAELARRASDPIRSTPLPAVELAFDQGASPWHTVCRVEAADRTGLLAALTAAFASSGIDVDAARVTTDGDRVIDVFELTGVTGAKLSAAEIAALREALATGVTSRRRRLRSGWSLVIAAVTNADPVIGGNDAHFTHEKQS